jgi:hypothetical protein
VGTNYSSPMQRFIPVIGMGGGFFVAGLIILLASKAPVPGDIIAIGIVGTALGVVMIGAGVIGMVRRRSKPSSG